MNLSPVLPVHEKAQVAPDSTNSPMYVAPELQGERPRAHVRCIPSPVFEQCLAPGGFGLGKASSRYHSVSAAEPSVGTGPETPPACAGFRHTRAHATHSALRTVLTSIAAQLQQFVSTWICPQYLDGRHT